MPPASLRVLHAIHDFLPRHRAGSEIYAHELCRAQLARGHHATVVCAEFDPAQAHGLVRWRVHDGVPVAEIVNNWTTRTFVDTYRPPVVAARLGSVLDAVQPDILHVHNLLNLSFDLPRLARARGARVVATLHDYTLVCPSGGQRIHRDEAHLCRQIDPARCARCFQASPFAQQAAWTSVAPSGTLGAAAAGAGRLLRGVAPRVMSALLRRVPRADVTPADINTRLDAARRLFDEIDLFIAPSRALADEFLALGLPATRLRVQDYGFRPQPAPVVPRQRTDQSLRIGFAGTLVWHKGVHVLIDAVRQLPADRVRLAVHGDTAVFPDYAAQLAERAGGLPVRFAGGFAREDAGAVFRDLDVLVVPSLWLENSPLVIHEAFQAGVPVVGSRIGGIPELVQDDLNGLLVAPGDVAALAAALGRLLVEPGLLSRFARAIPAVRSMTEDADSWDAIYDHLLAPAGAASPA